MLDKDILTPKEVAEYLRCGKALVYESIHRGEIPAFKLGGRLFISKAALERKLMESGKCQEDPVANR